MNFSKTNLIFWTLCVFLQIGQTHAISPDYMNQMSCKNWRTQLHQPMAFPSFVNTTAFKKEFIQTKSSDEDEGDYYTDIFKPRTPQQLFNSQILAVTSDAGYGGEWTSAGFTVHLKGHFPNVLQHAQTHLKINQWQTKVEKYEDENGRMITQKTYFAIQPYFAANQARYVRLYLDNTTDSISFSCRAIEGDIFMFIDNMMQN